MGASIIVQCDVTDLGSEISMRQKVDLGETALAYVHSYKTLSLASTPESLSLGEIAVSLVDFVMVRNHGTTAIKVDTTISGAVTLANFNSEMRIPAGESRCWTPASGTVSTALMCSADSNAYEYLVLGRFT